MKKCRQGHKLLKLSPSQNYSAGRAHNVADFYFIMPDFDIYCNNLTRKTNILSEIPDVAAHLLHQSIVIITANIPAGKDADWGDLYLPN